MPQLLIKGPASLPIRLFISQWSHIPEQRAGLPDHASLTTPVKKKKKSVGSRKQVQLSPTRTTDLQQWNNFTPELEPMKKERICKKRKDSDQKMADIRAHGTNSQEVLFGR